jgi:phosphotransferase system enzyme I (PtsP)
VPMVGSIEEFRAIEERLRSASSAVPPVGAMIEVPSALLEIDELAAEADFLCVGTNDLTQHLLGVDRTNARVNKYFDPCHPAVVRALHRIARAARRASKSLCVCGEAASNPLFLPIWIGLGVDRLSVHTARIPLLRALRRRIAPRAAREVVKEILALDTTDAIRERLRGAVPDEVRPYVAVATASKAPG